MSSLSMTAGSYFNAPKAVWSPKVHFNPAALSKARRKTTEYDFVGRHSLNALDELWRTASERNGVLLGKFRRARRGKAD